MATSAALPWMEKPCAVKPPQRIAAHIPTTANTPTKSKLSRMTARRRSPRRARRASPKTSAGGVAAGLVGVLPALCSVTCAGGASAGLAANGAPQEIQEPLSESFCAPQEGQNIATSFSACCDGSQRMPEVESHKNLALNTGGSPGPFQLENSHSLPRLLWFTGLFWRCRERPKWMFGRRHYRGQW